MDRPAGTAAKRPRSPDDGERLAKRVAAQVPCSRREAEQYIAEGFVKVDGQRAELPQMRVRPDQHVDIDPQAQLQDALPVTFLLHKPEGMGPQAAAALLTQAAHWGEDTSGIRPSRTHLLGRKPLLALPDPASGLCILSQDFRVVRKLTEDAGVIEQELVAEVRGEIAPNGLARLCQGLRWDGQPLPPARVSWQSETRLRFALKGIAPAWIEWMCGQVGLELVGLRRIRIGRVAMAGLPVGQWRYLPVGERF